MGSDRKTLSTPTSDAPVPSSRNSLVDLPHGSLPMEYP
jgi:hypothetical protein